MEFVRFGDLTPVDYKKLDPDKFGPFHSPPARKGIFAFIYPYIDQYLYAWKYDHDKFKELSRKDRKKFTHNGMIWCHFVDFAMHGRVVGPWVEVHTDDLGELLKKQAHSDAKSLMKMHKSWGDNRVVINPYKRGLNGFMSRDHLEVFIEKIK